MAEELNYRVNLTKGGMEGPEAANAELEKLTRTIAKLAGKHIRIKISVENPREWTTNESWLRQLLPEYKKSLRTLQQTREEVEREGKIENDYGFRRREKFRAETARIGKRSMAEVERGERFENDYDIRKMLSERSSSPEGKKEAFRQAALKKGATEAQAAEFAELKLADSTRKFQNELKLLQEPMDYLSQGLRTIGAGGFRRGVAQIVTGSLGGGVGAELIGGFTGAIASSLALPIAWAIGNAMMRAIPAIISEREQSGRFGAGIGDPKISPEMEILRTREGGLWSGEKSGGKDRWTQVARTLETIPGISLQEIRLRTSQIMAIGDAADNGSDPGSLAKQYFAMKRLGTSEQRKQLVENNPFIEEALKQNLHNTLTRMIPNFFESSPEYQHGYLMNQIQTHNIGDKDIENAMDRAVRNPKISGPIESSVNSFAGQWRSFWSDLWGDLTNPKAFFQGKTNHPLEMSGINASLGPAAKDVDKFHPAPLGPMQYGWTSFSGLAEQMQMMYSGAPAQGIDANTAELKNVTTALNANTLAHGGAVGRGAPALGQQVPAPTH